MSEVDEVKGPQGKSLLKGMLAGLIGGIAGTAAKTVLEKIYPPRTHGEPEPPDVLTEKIAGPNLTEGQQEVATEAIHWTFGALAGAAYGGLVEYYPAAASKEGASFGIALATLTHEGALPALGLSNEEHTDREHASEMTSHVGYGVVTEVVRGFVRKML